MIAEVDAALEALVRRDAVNGARVDVLFDAPTKEWVARRNAPAIDLYLYDIREDLPRRQLAREDVRNADGIVTERRLPVRRFRLSYLVTAWTQRPEDEHRLLAACLATFVGNEFLPPDLVSGSLSQAPYPVYLMTCMPPTEDRSIADVWSALGGELKPSLDLIAIAPLDPNWRQEVAAAVTDGPTLGLGRASTDGGGSELVMAGREGRRPGAAPSQGGRHGIWRRRDGAPLGPGDAALQEEMIGPGPRRPTAGAGYGANADGAGGKPGSSEDVSPGRRLRIRGIQRS